MDITDQKIGLLKRYALLMAQTNVAMVKKDEFMNLIQNEFTPKEAHDLLEFLEFIKFASPQQKKEIMERAALPAGHKISSLN